MSSVQKNQNVLKQFIKNEDNVLFKLNYFLKVGKFFLTAQIFLTAQSTSTS